MRVFQHRNVNGAYHHAMHLIHHIGVPEDTRNGPVRVFLEPICTVYRQPNERVLMDPDRRANPFFHLFESMWMLAGRNDGKWLDTYVSDFSSRFGEPHKDGRIHGAYGYRWRNHFGGDQLEKLIALLQADPGTRQAVLQMWDPRHDLGADVRDKPCNTSIYFRRIQDTLDMTVSCRSNDIVWGAYGANAVHMSVLLEYMAWRLETRVGIYRQVSNNLHLYDSSTVTFDISKPLIDPYANGIIKAHPLFTGLDAEQYAFEDQLDEWMESPTTAVSGTPGSIFDTLLIPMAVAHSLWKNKERNKAIVVAETITHTDWRAAALQWINHKST